MKVSIHQALARLPAGRTAQIIINEQRFDAAPGDAFFVAAGVAHKFENFSSDFATWVVFYGPPGGEQ